MRFSFDIHSPASSRASQPRAGFALLITITLLAFLVILLLGLAVYTRVETAVAGNTQRQAQARENALLGLNVALRQLQLHAGPDTRVTATAQNFGGIDGTRHYTGVWSGDATTTDTPAVPLTWLVSGNEFSKPDTSEGAAEGSTVVAPLAVTPATPGARVQNLVGPKSTSDTNRSANWVDAPLVDITATGIPGTPATANTTIGRYAWWVGDQGVKAPVAIPDPTNAITFAPYDSADLRSRIRQQLTLGAGASNASDGAPLLEPQDTNNATLVAEGKVAAANQLAFLRTPSNAPVGLARVQQNFHAWSPNNFAVLANTKIGGLRQDLSLQPTLLGSAFVAWANYPAYMEKFKPDSVETPTVSEGGTATPTTPATTSTAPTILPPYGDEPLRRRYVMTPQVLTGNSGGSHQVAPVLTYFLLTFNIRTELTAGGNRTTAVKPLEVRARWMFSLWNPYSSALVPENLQMEITGLPNIVRVVDEDADSPGVVPPFSLQSAFGSPLLINLPWTSANAPAGSPSADRQSWLPGRVYTWRSAENKNKDTPPPSEGYSSDFYSRTLNDSGEGAIRAINGSLDGGHLSHLDVTGGSQLRITLYVLHGDGTRTRVGGARSPLFNGQFTTDQQMINGNDFQFSYVFRLAESVDTVTEPGSWLTTLQRDFRRGTLGPEFFVFGENGDNPRDYGKSYSKIKDPNRLLDRAENSWTYNEDVSVFELPRGPILSVGALQHFRIVASRPFMIGNPWGTAASLNGYRLGSLFDRFFFSGIVDGMAPTTTSSGDLILPNPLLKPLRKEDGAKITVDDIRATATAAVPDPPVDGTGDGTAVTPETPDETPPDATATPPDQTDARSSKYFLQAGAFNLNSANVAAWTAVLRGVRFPSPHSFTYLDATEASGTAEDGAKATVQSGDAQFFRFSQSAQETYKAEPGLSAPGENAITPPNTHLFRRGMRTLTAAQVAALAAKIVELVHTKHAAADTFGGPFRSLEEFLAPSALFAGVDADGNVLGGRSLLEAAIADAGINADIAEFSSQWLTQADVMTALAPILFPRSDTFVIRTYGEAVNSATTAVEGRAWAEAIVQRLPEYFDRSMAAESLPSAFEPAPSPDDPDAQPTSTAAQQLNKLYGRRFKVISFRWLTRSDI